MTLNTLTFSLPQQIKEAVGLSLADWTQNNKVARVWAKDATVWTCEDEAKWLD